MRRGSRDNVLAGTLVIASIAAAVVVVILLAGGFDTVTRKGYTVDFPFSTGVTGLKRGSVVELAGVRVGSVGSIKLMPESTNAATGETEQFVRVHFRIDRHHEVHKDARIELVKELLGGSSRLNITSLGEEGIADDRTPAFGVAGGGLLDKVGGGAGKPLLDTVLGDERAGKVDTFIDHWSAVGAKSEGAVDRFNTFYDENAEGWASAVTDILAYFRDKLPEQVQTVVAQFEVGGEFFKKVEALFVENREAIAEAIDSYRSIGARIDGFTERKEQDLEQIVDATRDTVTNARDILARFDGGDDDPLVRISSRAERMLDEYTRLGEQGNQIAAENRADMRRAIARLRLTADQALDTMLEVRRAPWRLLYRPDERETAYELLYDSARQYARAVSDLDSVTTSTASLIEASRAGGGPIDVATLSDITKQIDEARKSFEQAQDHFLDVLLSIDASE